MLDQLRADALGGRLDLLEHPGDAHLCDRVPATQVEQPVLALHEGLQARLDRVGVGVGVGVRVRVRARVRVRVRARVRVRVRVRARVRVRIRVRRWPPPPAAAGGA